MATVSLRVRRGAKGETPRYDTFEAPFTAGMSVLDALMWIRGHADGSLAVRYSCINANACKECMVLIDGVTEYACTARLKAEGATVEPLDNKALIRDLVTEITPPKERVSAALQGRK
jgi:succinate dehydrogenase/fumarate reductase-like Fe-S protein